MIRKSGNRFSEMIMLRAPSFRSYVAKSMLALRLKLLDLPNIP
jgi:hypothetical protein